MTFSLTWLPDVLKAAGLKVAQVDGWQTRGNADMGPIRGIICHHTGGSKNGNMPTLGILVNGRPASPGVPALSGPLSQLGLGRDGTFYVIAAGRCNHAGAGKWKESSTGNSSFIGIEAENTGGRADPWPQIQVDAYQRGCAAILKHLALSAEDCCGHREYALPSGRKTDPSFEMVPFREAVGRFMSGATPTPALIPVQEPAGKQRATLRRGAKGEDVVALQKLLGIKPDGDFGGGTEAKVRERQRQLGIVPDGIVGPKTWAAFDKK